MQVRSVNVLGRKERIKWTMIDEGLKVTLPKLKLSDPDGAFVSKIALLY